MRQDDEWLQLPIVVPIRTGITMIEGTAASSGTREITTLMPHAEMKLRVKAPTFSFRISFYQGIEGFTGWHPGMPSAPAGQPLPRLPSLRPRTAPRSDGVLRAVRPRRACAA